MNNLMGLKDIKENLRVAFAIAAQTDNETPDDLAWARGVIERFHSLMDELIAEAAPPPPGTAQAGVARFFAENEGNIDPLWIRYGEAPQPGTGDSHGQAHGTRKA